MSILEGVSNIIEKKFGSEIVYHEKYTKTKQKST